MVVGCRWPAGSRCCCRAGGGGDRARRGRPRAAATRSFGRRARPGLAPRRRRASLRLPARPLAPWARASTRLDERQLEAVGVRDREDARAPGHILRLLIERPTARLDLCGQPIDVLYGVIIEATPQTFLPITSLRKVVLAQHERDGAGVQLTALQRTVLAPLVAHNEAQDVAIEGDAALQIGRSQRRRDAAQAQRFWLAPRGGAGFGFGLLLGRHQQCSVGVSKRSEPPRVSPDSPFPHNHRSNRSWRPATPSRFGKASSETAKAASKRKAAYSAARSASARASRARKGRTPKSCSRPRTPAASAWRSRPVSRRRVIPRTASKRARPSRSKLWMGRPRSPAAPWTCGAKSLASTRPPSGRLPRRRRRTVLCRRRFRATSRLRWMQSSPDSA